MPLQACLTVYFKLHRSCTITSVLWPMRRIDDVYTTKKASIPSAPFFNQRKRIKEQCACSMYKECWKAKCQWANHICTAGISFYTIHSWNVLNSVAQLAASKSTPVPPFSRLLFSWAAQRMAVWAAKRLLQCRLAGLGAMLAGSEKPMGGGCCFWGKEGGREGGGEMPT